MTLKVLSGNETRPRVVNEAVRKLQELSGALQPLDATLTALAAYNTNGLLTQTAADTFAGRTIAGTTEQITVTNGNGVSGNPTLSLPADVLIPTVLTVPNTGLHLLDTNASHDLIIKPGSDLTADKTLTLTTGDADLTLDCAALAGASTAWTAYTPTIAPSAGAFTSAAAAGRYKIVGKTTLFSITITITTNGTGSGFISATLPSTTVSRALFIGRNDTAGTWLGAAANAAANSVGIVTLANAYPGADSTVLVVGGVYEST
jgi:hypothetical protein